MRKFYLLILTGIFVSTTNAQINYSFSAVSGTYTAITGTAVTLTATGADGGAGGMDEGYANAIPIGFNFTYNGAATPFTTIGVTSNGFLYLGSTNFSSSSTIYSNNLTSGFAPQRPLIAPLWDDMLIGGVQYSTSGSAPNRVFTMQWDNVQWNYAATAAAVSFQVKLYETTNVIEFIYNNLGGALNSASASIGITAAGTGAANFLSLNNTSTSPTASSSTETSNINTVPATGQVYRFTPVAQAANDIAVDVVYALGKAGKGTLAYVRAYLKNLGTAAGSNVPVTLTVTGANSYSTSVNITTFAAGAAGFVAFNGFLLSNTGTNTITVSVPSDQVNTNNSAATTQEVTTNELSYAVGTTMTSGVNAGTGNEVAVKLSVPYANTINQISAYFNGANGYDVTIYNNVAGAPGTAIWTQTGSTSTTGLNTIAVTPPAAVTDTFYVAFKQTGAALALGYQTETPLRTNAFFLKSGTAAWFDLSGNSTNTFRLMVGATTATALPVTVVDFAAAKSNGSHLLTWSTSVETNNKGFEIERSANGERFSSIGFVGTKAEGGNSSSSNNYSFVDETPLDATNYYRLKQIDKDGRTWYSQVLTLKGDKPELTLAALYPNPAKDQVTLLVGNAVSERATVTVTDLQGKTVKHLTTTLMAGDNNIRLNIADLAAGTYYIRLVTDSGMKTTQLIKH